MLHSARKLHWHAARARGQAERFGRVRECGRVQYMLEASDGSEPKPLRSRCDCWRVCKRCLDRRKWKLTQGIGKVRQKAYALYHWQTNRRYRGKEGKWSEKLFTLTVPHGESPADDTAVLRSVWPKVYRKIRKHFADRGIKQSIPWCRALEVSPTSTGGHAHLHVWWLGPFLDVALLRVWWGEALESGVGALARTCPRRSVDQVLREGRDRRLATWLGRRRDVPWPVVHIMAAAGAAGEYATKIGVSRYVVKGSETLELSAPHAASIYEAFEGTRAVQWARGWAPKVGAADPMVVWRLRRATQAELRKFNEDEPKTSPKTAGMHVACRHVDSS